MFAAASILKGVFMDEHRVLLDAFAEARRSWDDPIALQPDVRAGSGNLQDVDLAELERRVEAHRAAMDVLAEALETGAAEESASRGTVASARTGLSDTESPRAEAEELRKHPPIDTGSPAPGNVVRTRR